MGLTTFQRLRKSPSGWFLEGNQDFDVLIWSETNREWIPGPVVAAFPPGTNPGDSFVWNGVEWTIVPGGSPVTLAGDANGPSGANQVNSLTGTAGGLNVLLDDMGSDPAEFSFVLRSPAGGPYVTAPVSSIVPPFVTEFDFILTGRQSLIDSGILPVADVFTLPTGSYAIKDPVTLLANERLLIPNGNTVLMMGLGQTKIISGAPTGTNALLSVAAGGILQAISLNLTATGAANAAIDNQGTIGSLMGRWVASGATGIGVRMGNGSWRDVQSFVQGGLNGLAHSGGDAVWNQSEFLPGTGNAVLATGAVAYVLGFIHCVITSSNAAALLFNAAIADLRLTYSRVNTTQANGACVRIEAASTVQCVGGKWFTSAAARGDGLQIAGNIAGGLLVEGIHGEEIGTAGVATEAFITYISGVVRRAQIIGCDTATTVSTCVNWAAASMPTLGLTLQGNSWDDPTPYNGFTQATPRVNSKGNLFQTGLLSETPIVP